MSCLEIASARFNSIAAPLNVWKPRQQTTGPLTKYEHAFAGQQPLQPTNGASA